MRTRFIAILAFMLALALSVAGLAQEAKKAQKTEKVEKAATKPKGMDSDLEALGLTEPQKAQLEKVIQDRAAKLKQLMDSGVQGDDLRKKKQEIRAWYEGELSKILTEDQKKKRAEMKQGPQAGEKKPK